MSLALVDRYRIERELGRGGMAAVYLAHDLKHDRPVALKVLHPEIATGLGPERFLREIRLTARLQHPHILPVFDSGAIPTGLWYTMPLVKGESLRDRLRRDAQLPVDAAVEIARQVAFALDFAHREGAVHRDIKPENILLSDGQALVADFGIARAIGSAGEEQLTATGLAIGTPAYMSPEQASGGDVDGRSDVYALGCVLYEMLAGEPPFSGPTPQAIIAKRFAHQPPSLRTVRPSLSRALDQAVRRALAPVPADRFDTAGQFANALVGYPAPGTTTQPTRRTLPKFTRRRFMAAGIAVGLGIGVAATGYVTARGLGFGSRSTLLSTGVFKPREPLLVADFVSRTPDTTLGLAVSDAFRTDFAQSSVVTTLSAPRVAEALERMRRPADTRLNPVVAREVALRQGVKAMVTGEVSALGKAYLITAQLVSAERGEVLVAGRETAEDATRIVAAVDRLAKHLRARIGESPTLLRSEPPLDEVTTSSLEALWKYNQALYAFHMKGDVTRAVTLLEEAVALDTGFATADRTLGAMLWDLDRERSVAAFDRALRHRERLTDQERDNTLGIYYQTVTAELDKAVAMYRATLERHPTDSTALGNLALAYLHLGQPARAEPLIRRVIDLDSLHSFEGGPLAYWHLVRAQLALGRPRDAELTVQRMTEAFGDSIELVAYTGIMLPSALGDYRTAEARTRAFKERHIAIGNQRTAVRQLAALASVRGRPTDAARYLREGMTISAREPNSVAYLEDAVSLGFLDIWFRRQPVHGIQTVEAALARFPLASIKPLDRPYLALAFAYASAGHSERARALLAEYEREVSPAYRRGEEFQRYWTRGVVALAEGRFADAITELQAFAASPRYCMPCGLAALGQAYDRAGQLDSATSVYERYITTLDLVRLSDIARLGDDGTQLAPAHKRLGELYEQRGDRERAREHYARFVELWKDCDPDLRPMVIEVKERLGQLGERSLEAR